MSAKVAFAALAACSVVCGCAGVSAWSLNGSHMARVEGAAPPRDPSMTTVVVTRPRSPCDNSDRITIVDETGRFVGEAIAGGRFEVSFAPGAHALYAWDREQVAWVRQRIPLYDNAGGVRLHIVDGGGVATLIVARPTAAKGHGHGCNTLAPISLFLAKPDEIDEVLDETTPLVAVDAPKLDAGEFEQHAAVARYRMRHDDP
jgi:hypothetical protein